MQSPSDEIALHGFNVAVLVTDGFELAELTAPCDALETAGAMTRIVSDRRGQVHSRNDGDQSGRIEVHLTFDEADPNSFDAVLLPGGALNAEHIKNLLQAQAFVRGMQDEGKPVAVLGEGVKLLAAAGLTKGRTLAARPEWDDARNAGAAWSDQEIAEDGNWISARHGTDLSVFSRRMIEVMARHVKANVRGTADERPDVGAGS